MYTMFGWSCYTDLIFPLSTRVHLKRILKQKCQKCHTGRLNSKALQTLMQARHTGFPSPWTGDMHASHVKKNRYLLHSRYQDMNKKSLQSTRRFHAHVPKKSPGMAECYTQNKKRTILSLKKEPMLHILNNPSESHYFGPQRRANKTALFLGPSWLLWFKKRVTLSLKKEPVLHILKNPLESQIIGPCRRASKIILQCL